MRATPLLAGALVAGVLAACGSPAGPTAMGSASPQLSPSTAADPSPTPTASPTGDASCSAAGLSARPQDALPAPVAATRRRIVEAATQCDLTALARLARAGSSQFTYSFGGGTDPASYWRQEEAAGREPLRLLVELLDRPYRQVQVAGSSQLVWPSAFAYDDWASVPAEDREALRPVYDEEDFAGFAEFGAYVGHRIGIAPDGDWLFFVAGD